MRYVRSLMLPLILCVSAFSVTACAGQERTQVAFPSAADLAVEPKPVPTIETLTSAQAAADYDIAVESWGERGWRSVGRVCRWAQRNGMAVACPPAPIDAPD